LIDINQYQAFTWGKYHNALPIITVRFCSDQDEERGDLLFNNRGLFGKGLLFFLYFY